MSLVLSIRYRNWGRVLALMLVAALGAAMGCGRVGFEGVAADGATDVGPDSARPDTGAADTGAADTGAVDTGTVDTGIDLDSGRPPDGGPVPVGPCTAPTTSELAQFSFDGDEGASALSDATGSADAVVRGGTATLVPGPSDCGEALSFTDGVDAVIADSPRWDLDEGSVDLWVWRPLGNPAPWAGILSRDAGGVAMPGHFSIYVTNDGRIVARLQNGGDWSLCSVLPMPEESWHHIGVNFGPGGFELWLDGVQEEGTGTPPMFPRDCVVGASSVTAGIAGNDNPWVLGANTARGAEGAADSTEPFLGGAMDHLRISSARRDFSIYAP